MATLDGLTLRPESLGDLPAIREVHRHAFHGSAEARLVDALRDAGDLAVSLVALLDSQVVAHVAFSPVTLQGDRCRGVGLAPLGVFPEHQSQGIGIQLASAGIDACHAAGHAWVVVLGETGFYHRLGFQTASTFGLENEYGVDEPFMVRELKEGALSGARGLVRYCEAFAVL